MQKNVLFLIADDWSPMAPCYGHDWLRMPNVEALAARGRVFDHAFCTTPSCAASRACLLTGQHSFGHGQQGHCHGDHGFRTRESVPTLPYLLNEAGYATGLVGKNHCGAEPTYPWSFARPGLHTPAVFRKYLAEFFETVGDRPFHLHVAPFEPHRKGDGFGNEVAHAGDEPVTYSPDEVVLPPWLPDLPEVREDFADYCQAVTRFDHQVGVAVEALKAAGREADTLIVVCADHGMPFVGAKATSYEGGHHCPLIVVDPSRPEAGRNRALVNWTDVFATLMDWHGVPVPDPCHGRSFLPVLHAAEPEGWDATLLAHGFHEVTNPYPYRILRERRFKYVLNILPELTLPIATDLYASKSWQAVESRRLADYGVRRTADMLHQPREKLYDLEADPWETRNLADDPAHRTTLERMRGEVCAFRERHGDVWLNADALQGHLASMTWDG